VSMMDGRAQNSQFTPDRPGRSTAGSLISAPGFAAHMSDCLPFPEWRQRLDSGSDAPRGCSVLAMFKGVISTLGAISVTKCVWHQSGLGTHPGNMEKKARQINDGRIPTDSRRDKHRQALTACGLVAATARSKACGVAGTTPADNGASSMTEQIRELQREGLSVPAACVMTGSPAEFGKHIADETEKWAKVVKFSGAKVE
jgi:hypothetical protein